MQDGKALQAGTSHFLGQNFAKAFDVTFKDKDNKRDFVWATSWGVSTRLVGALVMAHSDDDGLVLPPRIASAHIAIIPIIHNEEARPKVMQYIDEVAARLKKIDYQGQPLRVIIDNRDLRGGEKAWGWIKKGIPLRLEVGLREIEAGQLNVFRRDKPHKEGTPFSVETIVDVLEEMQENLLQKAIAFRNQNTIEIDDKKEFYDFFTAKGEEIHGGFALCHWNGDPAIEAKVKEDLNVTIRCIPLHGEEKPGKCLFTGERSARRVIFAKSY